MVVGRQHVHYGMDASIEAVYWPVWLNGRSRCTCVGNVERAQRFRRRASQTVARVCGWAPPVTHPPCVPFARTVKFSSIVADARGSGVAADTS